MDISARMMDIAARTGKGDRYLFLYIIDCTVKKNVPDPFFCLTPFSAASRPKGGIPKENR
jgi:hypothetical protein